MFEDESVSKTTVDHIGKPQKMSLHTADLQAQINTKANQSDLDELKNSKASCFDTEMLIRGVEILHKQVI
jgi:hypothetical protein